MKIIYRNAIIFLSLLSAFCCESPDGHKLPDGLNSEQLLFKISVIDDRPWLRAETNWVVEFTLWQNGMAIVQNPNIRVAKTFRCGKSKCEEFASNLVQVGFFDEHLLTRRSWIGPDSRYTLMEAWQGDRRFILKSWHEQFENNPNLIVTEDGVEPLNGRSRDKVFQNASPEYKRFRRVWSKVRNLVAALRTDLEQHGDK